jgi:hypothetical protein
MVYSRPIELVDAQELIYNGKLKEALDIISIFEISNKLDINPEDQLSILLIKGRIFVYFEKYKKIAELGEQAYKLSKTLDRRLETIEALTLKVFIASSGQVEDALNLILEAEELIKSVNDVSLSQISRLKLYIVYAKTWIYYNSNYNRYFRRLN